jgi:hypothetical protein
MSWKYLKTFSGVLEVIEAIKLMKSLLPLAIYLLNFVIAGMVASGKVNPACQNDVLNAFIDVGGYVLLFVTSGISLLHAFRHPNQSPVVTQSPIAPSVSQPVFTEVPNGGTPPPAHS